MGVQIDDKDLIMQVLEGPPKEYDMIVTILNARYKINELTIDKLQEELNMYYERRRSKKGSKLKSNELDDGKHEETALVTGSFKGRCQGCGKFGHKKSDCPGEKKGNGKVHGEMLLFWEEMT